MTRYPSLLPLALLALALAGCGGSSPPPPALSSTSHTERLGAVRDAQNRYGAHKRPPLADDKEALVGRWNHQLTDVVYMSFHADGTFKKTALLNSVEGSYRFLSEGVLELTAQGGYAWEMKYRLSGDTLEVKEDLIWRHYTRAKRCRPPPRISGRGGGTVTGEQR